MKKIQFSLVLANKAGELARLADVVSGAEVNIEAMSISDGIHTGVVKMVVDRPDAARAALQKASLQFSEQEVLAVPLSNTPGALAELCGKLAKDGLSIDYVYGSTCRCADDDKCDCQCTLMVSVADISTAEDTVGLILAGWPRP
jgi:hypothetical protein